MDNLAASSPFTAYHGVSSDDPRSGVRLRAPDALKIDVRNLLRPSAVTGRNDVDSGKLRDGREYDVVLLTEDHARQNIALQEVVYAGLETRNKFFITPKTQNDFVRHATKGDAVFGAVLDGRLIGQTLVVLPTQKHPDTEVQGMRLDVRPENLAVLCGSLVHPDFRGHKVQMTLTKARLAFAHASERTDAISSICVDNCASWMTLMRNGVSIHSIGADPAISPKAVYFMHAPLGPLIHGALRTAFDKVSPRNVAFDNLDVQRTLLEEGYRGVIYDSADRSIGFKKAIGCGEVL